MNNFYQSRSKCITDTNEKKNPKKDQKTNSKKDLTTWSSNCSQFFSFVGKRYLNIFSDPIIMIYFIANTLVYIGFAVPYVYTVVRISLAYFSVHGFDCKAALLLSQDRAACLGIVRSEASFLISVMGIGSIFGKIVLGYIADLPCINRLYLYNLCIITCGISKLCAYAKRRSVIY